MRTVLGIALFVLLGALGAARHEFYVSITEVHRAGDTLQVAMRLFTDDLERAVNEGREETVFLDPHTDRDRSQRVVSAYLARHFAVSIAARELKEEWLGHEYVEDVTWAYAQVILPPETHIAFVRNTVLTDLLPDQQNILHFQSGDRFEKLLTNRSKPEVRVLLEE